MNQYNPSEFTLDSYKQLLQLAKSRFPFANFLDFKTKDNFLLLRHDIDFSLIKALEIAQLEHQYNIQSTFFIHLHNDFYNALDLQSLKLVKEIIKLGHFIGLHFDIHYYDIKLQEDLVHWLEFEKSIMEMVFNTEINVFSFHNTNEYTMSFEEEEYGGMINTYSTYFKENVSYCSDSNGYWRFQKLQDVLVDPKVSKLQVLIHPGWWSIQELTPREKVVNYAKNRYEATVSEYDQALISFGRVNIK